MKNYFPYPFYQSLRFRFGLLFGLLFLLFLLGVIFFLYGNVKDNLEKSFESRLEGGANLVLQKTDVSPVTLPLPHEEEYFLLTYNNTLKTDTLFNNLPLSAKLLLTDHHSTTTVWRFTKASKILETGGVITIVYELAANELNKSVQQLQLLLFIYVPAAFIISLLSGYFLSGFLLKPISHIITKANQTDLQNEIRLLDEPKTKDELHSLTIALNRMLERIQKQSQQQNAFFASASHELRTPLSNMLTELQVLQLKNIPDAMEVVLQNQTTEVQRLNKLVNDFLLMSQLKSGNVSIHKKLINVSEICIDSIEGLQLKARQQLQTFKITLQPTDGEFKILADEDQLSIIINNLLDNAIKYAQPSSIILIKISQSNENILLQVVNKTNNDIKHVDELKSDFHRRGFYKEGFGLGLWIVDQLVQKNNGRLLLSFDAPYFSAEAIFLPNFKDNSHQHKPA